MFSSIVFVLLAAFVSLIFWIIEQKWRFRSLNCLPGPTSLPILGSALEFGNNPVDKLKNLYRLSNTYGTTLASWLGPTRCFILTSDPDLVEFILSSPKHIKKSKSYDLFKPWLGNGLLVSTGSHWQKRRKAITPAFHFKILEEFLPTFLLNADILTKRLSEKVNEEKSDIYPLICTYTLDNICETAMGTSVEAQKHEDNQYPQAIKCLCQIITNRIFSSWKGFEAIYKYSEDFIVQNKYLQTIHGFIDDVISNRRKLLKGGKQLKEDEIIDELGRKKRIAFLDLLLQAKINGEYLRNEEIREEVNTFMFEGHDTTASAICFALFELARNQDIQEKLVKEFDELFGNEYSRILTQSDLSQMKYAELVLKETLRLYPPVPYYGRELTEDCCYNGVLLPKGLHVMIFTSYLHRRPELFKNPERFYPERFLPESEDTRHPFAYIPFSAGPRNCIGQKFAMNEMKVTLYKILSKFEILPADKKYDVVLSAEIILKSANGVSVKVRRRKT